MYVACAGMDTIQEKKDKQKKQDFEMEAGRKRKTHGDWRQAKRTKPIGRVELPTSSLLMMCSNQLS